jgi:colanic acid/amylovoran biosynthesis glycosyltransferase
MKSSPIVWEVVEKYLPRTETFVYTSLTSLVDARPAVVSYGKLVNQDEFPLPAAPIFSLYDKLRKPRHFVRRCAAKLFRTEWISRAAVSECRSIARQYPPDVIHAHFGPVGYQALKLKRAYHVPLITTFYGYDTNPTSDLPNWREHRSKLFEEGDLFLVEGPFMRKALIELGCPPERIEIQRIGIDISKFPPIRKRLARSVPVILFAARFVEKKGLEYGLEALGKLHRAGNDFECRIVGTGPLEEKLRDLTKALQLSDTVRFLGSLSYAGFIQELEKADIFVQPSVTAANGDNEGGAPTTLLEAQARGVPVVTTRHADIPHVVVPDQSALVVDERDSDGLAEALRSLLGHPEKWDAMGRAGRGFVDQSHSSIILARNLEAIYSRIAAGHFNHSPTGQRFRVSESS